MGKLWRQGSLTWASELCKGSLSETSISEIKIQSVSVHAVRLRVIGYNNWVPTDPSDRSQVPLITIHCFTRMRDRYFDKTVVVDETHSHLSEVLFLFGVNINVISDINENHQRLKSCCCSPFFFFFIAKAIFAFRKVNSLSTLPSPSLLLLARTWQAAQQN